MAIFAATEATLFGAIVGSYFYLRFESTQWPPAGIPEPKVVGPVVLTLLLLGATVPFWLALGAARRGLRIRAVALLAAATVVQAVYLALQIHLLNGDLARFHPQADAYASIYYVLLGVAHAHVALGLVFDLWLLVRIGTRLTPYRLTALESVGLYWLVINGLAVVVLLTELSPRL
jgi:heme/copper-type cytochrome/quinol oxidase subunit 3